VIGDYDPTSPAYSASEYCIVEDEEAGRKRAREWSDEEMNVTTHLRYTISRQSGYWMPRMPPNLKVLYAVVDDKYNAPAYITKLWEDYDRCAMHCVSPPRLHIYARFLTYSTIQSILPNKRFQWPYNMVLHYNAERNYGMCVYQRKRILDIHTPWSMVSTPKDVNWFVESMPPKCWELSPSLR
jgi:hypothetical protein